MFSASETWGKSCEVFRDLKSTEVTTDLLQWLLLARRDINFHAVLNERRGDHFPNAGSSTSNKGDLTCIVVLYFH